MSASIYEWVAEQLQCIRPVGRLMVVRLIQSHDKAVTSIPDLAFLGVQQAWLQQMRLAQAQPHASAW